MEEGRRTNGGEPGGASMPQGTSSTAKVTHSGKVEFTEDATASAKSYMSDTGGESAILVSSGTVNLLDVTVTKSGGESSEDSDFYGTNAAVIAINDATINITSGKVETNAAHANAVFAYGEGTINIQDARITTLGDNSGGIMVTGGGTLNAYNLAVETSGRSAAAIRSDRGGGTMKVTGGTYLTSGVGSPVVYSTANVTVADATMTATASEGVVIEGKNSVTLSNVLLTDTNDKLNGNSETYKNIFIYQSMSGEADEGVGTFAATNSEIVTNKGDTFFVTNTTAEITLAGNVIINNDKDGALLRAQSGKWGTSGKNGGAVTMNWKGQQAEGDIVLDSISTLEFNLSNESYYRGAINTNNTAKTINLTVSADSVVVLTGNSYVTKLENADTTNMNIYANGYKLYVNGTEAKINQSADIPEMTTKAVDETVETVEVVENTDTGVPGWIWWTMGGGILVVAIIIVVAILRKKQRARSLADEKLVMPNVPPEASDNN